MTRWPRDGPDHGIGHGTRREAPGPGALLPRLRHGANAMHLELGQADLQQQRLHLRSRCARSRRHATHRPGLARTDQRSSGWS